MAKLFLNGRERTVLHTDVHFYRQLHPSTNRPTTLPMGGIFTVTLEADGTTDLLHLMTSSDRQCNGYIRLYKYDGLSKLYDYEFFDTYVVGFRQNIEPEKQGCHYGYYRRYELESRKTGKRGIRNYRGADYRT